REPLAAALRRPRREALDQSGGERLTRLAAATRAAGVLLHPTSLPGPGGIGDIGDIGDEAIAFLDWMRGAGLRIWQVLPLNPPGYGNSPYGCLSSYAGNPLLISLPSIGVASSD